MLKSDRSWPLPYPQLARCALASASCSGDSDLAVSEPFSTRRDQGERTLKSDSQSVVQSQMGRRGFLRSVGGAVALASMGGLLTTGCDPDPQDGFGLTLTESKNTGRLRYFRFATD